VLLLPGDVFASRAPDPVLQQVEDFHDGGVSANDCLRPVSRYFDRIMRPEQLLKALPRAVHVLTDPAFVRTGHACATARRADDGLRFSADFFAPPLVLFRAPAPADAEIESRGQGAARGATTTHHRGWRRPLRGCFGAVACFRRSARNPPL